jgi:hypothetical protein
LTSVAKIKLSSDLAKRFQLPGEPVETFINDVVKKSKRLVFPGNSIAEHLKRGFRAEIQRYLALRPPNGDDLAALIQAAREAETMTVEALDTTGIASQLRQMQAQISKISIKPVIDFADHENTDRNITFPTPIPPPPLPRVVYRNAPQYQNNNSVPYNNNNNSRPRNTGYNNNRGGFNNSTRGNPSKYRGVYSNSAPAPNNRYSAAGGYRGNRGRYGNAPREFTTNPPKSDRRDSTGPGYRLLYPAVEHTPIRRQQSLTTIDRHTQTLPTMSTQETLQFDPRDRELTLPRPKLQSNVYRTLDGFNTHTTKTYILRGDTYILDSADTHTNVQCEHDNHIWPTNVGIAPEHWTALCERHNFML